MDSKKETKIEATEGKQQPRAPIKRPEEKVKIKLKKGRTSIQRYIYKTKNFSNIGFEPKKNLCF
jgi:hypothetical protein